MSDLITRLRNPPFGTETSERNLMTAAADMIEAQAEMITTLNGALSSIRANTLDEVANLIGYLPEAVRRIRALKVKP